MERVQMLPQGVGFTPNAPDWTNFVGIVCSTKPAIGKSLHLYYDDRTNLFDISWEVEGEIQFWQTKDASEALRVYHLVSKWMD